MYLHYSCANGKRNGETFTDAKVVEKTLRSLTNDFENVVCAIEELRNLEGKKKKKSL